MFDFISTAFDLNLQICLLPQKKDFLIVGGLNQLIFVLFYAN